MSSSARPRGAGAPARQPAVGGWQGRAQQVRFFGRPLASLAGDAAGRASPTMKLSPPLITGIRHAKRRGAAEWGGRRRTPLIQASFFPPLITRLASFGFAAPLGAPISGGGVSSTSGTRPEHEWSKLFHQPNLQYFVIIFLLSSKRRMFHIFKRLKSSSDSCFYTPTDFQSDIKNKGISVRSEGQLRNTYSYADYGPP